MAKSVKPFCQNLANILLTFGRYIAQFKKHYLVFEVAILSLKSHFPFFTFLDSDLIKGG